MILSPQIYIKVQDLINCLGSEVREPLLNHSENVCETRLLFISRTINSDLEQLLQETCQTLCSLLMGNFEICELFFNTFTFLKSKITRIKKERHAIPSDS